MSQIQVLVWKIQHFFGFKPIWPVTEAPQLRRLLLYPHRGKLLRVKERHMYSSTHGITSFLNIQVSLNKMIDDSSIKLIVFVVVRARPPLTHGVHMASCKSTGTKSVIKS